MTEVSSVPVWEFSMFVYFFSYIVITTALLEKRKKEEKILKWKKILHMWLIGIFLWPIQGIIIFPEKSAAVLFLGMVLSLGNMSIVPITILLSWLLFATGANGLYFLIRGKRPTLEF